MQRSDSYSHTTNMTGQSRYASTQATSSAFSASANPNEDWTKISDLAERRRIQNRIAQRNYRKKLKRRLEDLERRAGSSSASPEQSHSELDVLSPKEPSQSERRPASRRTSKASASYEAQQLSPEVLQLDEHPSLFGSTRQITPSTASAVTFSTYPPATAYMRPEFQQPSIYQPPPNHFENFQYSLDYSQSLPPTLPSMLHPSYITKQDQLPADQDLLNPLSMNYASLAGLEVPSNREFLSSNAQTPPLSDLFSLTQSPSESSNYFDFPLTPLSRCMTPNFQLFDISCN